MRGRIEALTERPDVLELVLREPVRESRRSIASAFRLDLDEDELVRVVVDHVVLDAGLACIGVAGDELRRCGPAGWSRA